MRGIGKPSYGRGSAHYRHPRCAPQAAFPSYSPDQGLPTFLESGRPGPTVNRSLPPLTRGESARLLSELAFSQSRYVSAVKASCIPAGLTGLPTPTHSTKQPKGICSCPSPEGQSLIHTSSIDPMLPTFLGVREHGVLPEKSGNPESCIAPSPHPREGSWLSGQTRVPFLNPGQGSITHLFQCKQRS